MNQISPVLKDKIRETCDQSFLIRAGEEEHRTRVSRRGHGRIIPYQFLDKGGLFRLPFDGTMNTSPFKFYNSFHLVELTGHKATNIKELLEGIQTVKGASIFHHTHQYLRELRFSKKVYGNDFSHWTLHVLQENALAEHLANIDIRDFETLQALREAIVKPIEAHLSRGGSVRSVPKELAFHFSNAITFQIPTDVFATDPASFCDAIKKLSSGSIYFHFLEARLRLEKPIDDFSHWFEDSLQEHEIAKKIRAIDPYNLHIDELKASIIAAVKSGQTRHWPASTLLQNIVRATKQLYRKISPKGPSAPS